MATVHSSHGDVEIDSDGRPLDPDNLVVSSENCADGSGSRIVQFDLDEYARHYGKRPDAYDILDLGYWLAYPKGGSRRRYIEPDPEFRKHAAEAAA